ncbi:M protein repeat protein [Marvinbryantia formatexigens DSM 14469]|uniref:M protein repeat protein n=1 Tax=Marvinbryantia formatexigens DSM 14469 TaxID=478749 RepID=C6LAY9_9FIRM|nr:PD-(D/E)XK nuclease family transposase [Marvinbryantia formatexigens]EET62120.1 M protein repeat protein [Marvinbryantia formatexigens DSM 14469]UWO26528.1 PD-(D/E)XK nuclease family transposase [Marvinbryantia formatexigens DSM 14469]SDF77286.1 PD-(D/E)XK nuclease family transposase [Marvinbryantia formatexigens]
MNNKLAMYFPMLRTREEALSEITGRSDLQNLFASWKKEQQEEFLDFITGARGVKVLYDFMFKEIMNPESAPERLEDLLSCLLEQKIKILRVLPNDTTRIADESSLLVTDIVAELEDGSVVNIEVQKIGYAFPGERSACYSADLLLRQYRRVRSQKQKAFSYRDIRDVFTIVFFEKSPAEFHRYPDIFLHRFTQKSDTGLKLNLLQQYLFIPLDIFRKIHQNKDIQSKLEAWLVFLSMDDPEEISRLLETYPEFRPLYAHIYDMCRNMEDVMGLFSEELRELDRNTVQYMIDEMQDNIDRKKVLLEQQKQQLEQINQQLIQKGQELSQQEQQLEQTNQQLEAQNQQLEAQNLQLEQTNQQLEAQNLQLEAQNLQLAQKDRQIAELQKLLQNR